MLEKGLIDGDQLSRAIAERYGLDHIDLNAFQVDMGAANLVSVQTARRFHAVPVGYIDSETLLLAMALWSNLYLAAGLGIVTAVIGADVAGGLYTQFLAKKAGINSRNS